MPKCKGTNSEGNPCQIEVGDGKEYCHFHEPEVTTKKDKKGLSNLEFFQAVIGILISISTAIIGWQAYLLNVNTNETNSQLKRIEQQFAENKFVFERAKDIYDRTEKYLNSEQDERRGKALVALISSLPDTKLRSELLSVVTVEAKSEIVKTSAAVSYIGDSLSNVAKNGQYYGTVSVEFLDDIKKVRTINAFGFKDSNGILWDVPKGTIIDGASIPKTLWSTVGSPFTGKYRDAAIIHDYYSTNKSRSWESVNKMFYEAMIASGVGKAKASILYTAVYTYGPRWDNSEK